jgi:hypothetical protein
MSDTPTNPADPKPAAIDLEHLPDDPALLKKLVLDLAAQLQREMTEKENLHHRLAQMLRHRFGRRVESIDPQQMELFLKQAQEQLKEEYDCVGQQSRGPTNRWAVTRILARRRIP